MSENTTKVEGLAFTAKDEASATADKIGASFERVHHAAERAREKVGEFAHHAATGALASVGLGFGLHSLFEKATEANSEMARITKQVAGAQFAFQGWKPGISQLDKMTASMGQGAEMAEKLHGIGLKLRAPIEDMAATYNQVAVIGFGKLGMSQKGVLDLTEKITAASKVYGISGVEAIEKIQRVLLTGHVSGRDVTGLGEMLRESLGQTKKGQHLSPDELMKRMSKGLGDMVPAAQKMGQNMAGSLFEAKMMVDEMLRDLTGPMFKEQTKSLSEWVEKIRTVKEDGKSIMTIYGDKIAGAFQTIKSATSFIVDHWKLLLGLYAASKLSSALTGFASKSMASSAATGGGMAGIMNVSAGTVNVNGTGVGAVVGAGIGNVMKPGLTSTMSKMAGLAAKVVLVTEGMAAYYGVLQVAWHYGEKLGDWMAAKGPQLNQGMLGGSNKALAQYAKMSGLDRNEAELVKSFADMDAKQRTQWADKLGLNKMKSEVVAGPYGGTVFQHRDLSPESLAEAFGKSVAKELLLMDPEYGRGKGVLDKKFSMLDDIGPNRNKTVPRGHGDINIQNLTITQDFKEADPDRVFHRVTNEISGLANSPGKGRLSTGMAGGL